MRHDPYFEPMGRPRGTVRAWLALMIVGVFLLAHLAAAGALLLVSGNTEAALAVLGALALETGVVTGFYFAGRSAVQLSE